MTPEISPEITLISQSDTLKPKLTNLRVTTQARDDANYVADALGMEQRATVEGILRIVRKMVEIEQVRGVGLEQLRRAVLGGKE